MSFWNWFFGKGRTVHFQPAYEHTAVAIERRQRDEEIAAQVDKNRALRNDTLRTMQDSRGYMGVMEQMLELKRRGL